ncbi:MAG TPA: ABC transporter substrate-binding protein [Trebonia sp.]|jgi:NitT/TauT family transport system substrate-binding protein
MRFCGIRPRFAVAAAIALSLAAATAACSNGAQAASPEKPDITVADFPSIDSAGLYIAQMDGLFAAAGLNVKIDEVYSGSQATVTGIEKGTYDISSADYVTYLDNEMEDGARLKIIAEASVLQPNELALLAPATSKIKSVTQLKGSTISVAASGDIATLLVDSLLSDNDISSRDVRFKPGIALPAAPAMLSKKAVAAAPVPEPFVSEGEEQYGLTEVADLDQGGTTDFPIQGFAVTQQWAQKYPATLRAFVSALTKGQEIADTDRGAVEQATEKFLQVPAMTAAVMALPEFPLSVDPQRLQRVLSAMVQFGFLPEKDSTFNVSSMTGA